MNKGFLESHSIYSLGEECGFNSHQSYILGLKKHFRPPWRPRKETKPRKHRALGVK